MQFHTLTDEHENQHQQKWKKYSEYLDQNQLLLVNIGMGPLERLRGIGRHRLGWLGRLINDNGRAIAVQFSRSGRDGTGGKPHINDGISAKLLGLCQHTGHRLAAGFHQQFRIAGQLASNQIFQRCGNIPSDMLGANRIALNESLYLEDFSARNGLCVYNNHTLSPFKNIQTFYRRVFNVPARLKNITWLFGFSN
jgi:hypothetical protein